MKNVLTKLLITSAVASSMMTSVMAAEEVYDMHGNVISQDQMENAIDLGNKCYVLLADHNLDMALASMPHGNPMGRHPIGGQSIFAALFVTQQIDLQNFSIPEDPLSRFLICVAATLKVCANPKAYLVKDNQTYRLLENWNVKYDLANKIIIGSLGPNQPVLLEFSKLMDAYEKLKQNAVNSVDPQDNMAAPVQVALIFDNTVLLEVFPKNHQQVIAEIKKIYDASSKTKAMPDPKRPGFSFTDQEETVAASILQQVPNSRDHYLTGLTVIFSPERAGAIFDKILNG